MVHPHLLIGRPRYLLLVAVGGMVGTLARWLVIDRMPQLHGLAWGELVVNLVGCFVLGLLLEVLLRRAADLTGHVALRLLLGTGFCGAFTTWSSLAVDAVRLAGDGRVAAAGAWVAAQVVAGVVLAAAGVALGVLTHRGWSPE